MRGGWYILVALVAVVLTLGVCEGEINKDLVNKKVERKVDVTSQLVKVATKITLENGGAAPVRSFLLAFTPAEKDSLSSLTVQVGNYHLTKINQ